MIAEEEEEKVQVFGTQKTKKDVKVADKSASITVTLFENLIRQVETGKSYIITNLSTRNYDGPKLTSTQSTSIHLAPNVESTSDVSISAEVTTIQGSIEQIQCFMKFKCPVCEKQITINDPHATKIKCSSCNLKSNKTALKQTLTCRLNFKDQNECNHGLLLFIHLS